MGVDRDGAFAEYVCIPATNVIAIDPSMDEDVVAMFDAVGNATHTALMFDLVGEDVLITGAGPIGIIAVAICKYAGARRVIITDIQDARLELAKKMGADAAVNTAKEDLMTVMKEQGLVEGFDVGLEMFRKRSCLKADDLRYEKRRKDQPSGSGQRPFQMDMNEVIPEKA